jgi:uroporphyrinogen decarboxylase
LNAKERVLTAIAQQKPDRVPLDFSANVATLQRLHRDLGTQQHLDLLERLHVDIVDLRGVVDPLYCGPVPRETWLPNGVKQNYWGWRTQVQETPTGPEEMYCDFLLSGCRTVEEMERHTWPQPDWFDFSGFSERLDAWQSYAIMASGASIWQHPTFLRGLEQLLVDLLDDATIANYLLDKFTDFYVAYFDRMFAAAPGKIDMLRIADDIGTQHGLLISPALFDQFFVSRLAKLVDMAHSHGVRVMFHSCGAIVPFINRIIALGVDVLDPIQVAADGMDPQVIKQRFGTRICLHGSIDTQFVLPRGSADDVRRTVRTMINVLGEGGGFILAPTHVLQTDVPTENVLALYDTAVASA